MIKNGVGSHVRKEREWYCCNVVVVKLPTPQGSATPSPSPPQPSPPPPLGWPGRPGCRPDCIHSPEVCGVGLMSTCVGGAPACLPHKVKGSESVFGGAPATHLIDAVFYSLFLHHCLCSVVIRGGLVCVLNTLLLDVIYLCAAYIFSCIGYCFHWVTQERKI